MEGVEELVVGHYMVRDAHCLNSHCVTLLPLTFPRLWSRQR